MPATEDFHFLLLPEFSSIGFMSAIEPLRVANRFQGALYRWHILSLDGGPVCASNGISLNAESALTSVDFRHQRHRRRRLQPPKPIHTRNGRLAPTDGSQRRNARRYRYRKLRAGRSRPPPTRTRNAPLGSSIGVPGALSVAGCQPGAIRNRCATHHVRRRHSLHRPHARPDRTPPRRRTRPPRSPSNSCSAASANARTTSACRSQRAYGIHNRKLIQVIGVMEQHMEEPLSPDALAEEIGVTRRQLERLFCSAMKDTPTHFYLGLRLARARELLQQTDMSITTVCVACGFESPSHFSRTYRTRFGSSPRQDRSSPRATAPVGETVATS